MKSIKSMLMGGAIVFGLAMCFTSCEGSLDDVFGEWDRPTQVPASAVEEAKVLGAALETGAKVTVTYTVGEKNYKATFTKNSDDSYTLVSNENITPSGARAMTRGYAGPSYFVSTDENASGRIQLKLEGDKLVFTVIDASSDAPIFVAKMNVVSGEVTVINTNAGGLDCTIGSVSANDKSLEVKNPEMKSVNIGINMIKYLVKFSEGETWADVVERYKDIDVVEITTTTDGYISVKFSKDLVVSTLHTAGVNDATAISYYNNNCSASFYLVYNNPSAMTARAMTRESASAPTYVQTTDVVGIFSGNTWPTYYLTTIAPGTILK